MTSPFRSSARGMAGGRTASEIPTTRFRSRCRRKGVERPRRMFLSGSAEMRQSRAGVKEIVTGHPLRGVGGYAAPRRVRARWVERLRRRVLLRIVAMDICQRPAHEIGTCGLCRLYRGGIEPRRIDRQGISLQARALRLRNGGQLDALERSSGVHIQCRHQRPVGGNLAEATGTVGVEREVGDVPGVTDEIGVFVTIVIIPRAIVISHIGHRDEVVAPRTDAIDMIGVTADVKIPTRVAVL